MFRKNKIEKEYIRRAENIKIPHINGEQFRKIDTTENKNIFKFPKYMVRVACICTIIIFSTVGINYFNYGNNVENGNNVESGNNEGSNVISTAFGIKAYAATTDGKDSVDLIENQVIEVPSGNIENGEINMKGIEIRGEKIKNIKASCINGSFLGIRGTDKDGAYFESISYVLDESEVDPYEASFNEKYHVAYSGNDYYYKESIRKIETGELQIEDVENLVTENIETGEIRSGKCIDSEMEKYKDGVEKIVKQEQEMLEKKVDANSTLITMTEPDDHSLNINLFGKECKQSILWSPKKEIIKELKEGNIYDYSKIEGDSIKIQVTFEDGTVKENTLNLSFNKEGNIIFELK